jgi:hypothetical protein
MQYQIDGKSDSGHSVKDVRYHPDARIELGLIDEFPGESLEAHLPLIPEQVDKSVSPDVRQSEPYNPQHYDNNPSERSRGPVISQNTP